MSRSSCSICGHPERSAIEQALREGTQREAAIRFSVSQSSLSRHHARHGDRELSPGVVLQLVSRLGDGDGELPAVPVAEITGRDLDHLGRLVAVARRLEAVGAAAQRWAMAGGDDSTAWARIAVHAGTAAARVQGQIADLERASGVGREGEGEWWARRVEVLAEALADWPEARVSVAAALGRLAVG